MKNTILIMSLIFISTACVPDKSKIQVTMNKKSKSNLQQASISSVQIINNQLVINGNGFSGVTNVKVNGLSLNENFSIESKTATKIIANSIRAFSFDVSKIFSLILSDASASATFTIDFSLCNATLHGKGFNCAAPVADKDVLAYDAVSGTWKPRPSSGLNYLGTFDASSNPGAGPAIQPAGAYYVISDDGTIAAVSFAVGDWLVSNGSVWQKIDNSTSVLSVHGRHGTVTAQSGDYTLDLLGDVSFPTAPVAGKVLKFDGTHWIAGDDLSGGGAGSVTTSAIAAGAVTDAKIDTVSASKITGTITNAQIADGTIVNADVNAAAAIDYSKLNVPNAAIPYAKLNIADGDIPASKISGLPSNSAVLATSIVDGDLTHAPDGNSVFDALATKLDKTGGTITTMLNVPPPVLDTEATTKLYVDTADNLRLNKTGGTITGILDLESDLRIKGGSNHVTIRGHASSAAYDLILPSTAGISGYVLRTDGVGNLSWVAPGAGAFAGTASRAVATDGAGALTTVTTTAAELGFVNGVTSSIQTQLNAKQETGNYLTALTGDVTATGPGSVAATVANVGGVTAANVAAGVTLANSATNLNTASTIVKRDASGNFIAGTITGTLSGNATNVTGVVAVANGGTGKSTLGLNNLLFGNTTAAVGEVASTTTPSVLLSANATGLPTWTTSTTGNVLKGSVTGVAFGTLAFSDLPSGILSGSGVANYVPYYTNAITLAASPMIISGSNVGFGALSPTTPVDINGAQTMRGIAAPAVSPATQGRIYYDSATNKFKVSQNGGAYVDLVSAGGSSTIDGLTDGIANSGSGQLFLGTNAGAANSGLSNTAVGQNAMQLNTTGFQNSAFGNAALSKNLTGGTNAAFGMYSMKENTAGNDNTAFGEQSLNSNQTGSGNTALGRQSLYGFTGGSHSNNTGVGYRTGVNVTTGNNNIFLGYGAGDSLTSGSSNIVIGYDVEAPSNTASNQMTIGNLIFGTGLTSTGTTVSSGKIGIGITAPAEKLSVAGIIQSTTGGFKFPDGSIQTAAYTTMLTDISAGISTACPMAYNFAVNYSTGTGWTCTLDLNGLSNATNGGSGLLATQLRWGYFYNYPTSFAIEDSADNSTWTTISASNNTGVQVLSAAVKRYVRFRSVDSDPFSNMAAVQVMGGPTSVNWAGNTPAFVLKETWRTSNGNVVIGPGRVGIGTTAPGAELHVVGDIQYTGIITDVSDRRLKKNLSPLERGLEMIRKIKTYSYIMKDDPKERTEYGVIAQDLQKINPNLVRIADEANGFLGVNYMGLLPFAINAIQDVDHETKNLRAENEKLKLQLKNVEDLQKIQNKKIEKLLKKMGIKSEEM